RTLFPYTTLFRSASRPGDAWEVWETKLRNEIDNCHKDKKEPITAGVDICIAEAITNNRDYPKPRSDNAIDQLNADIRAGSIIMNIREAFDLLDRKIGIKSNFIGDGLALPSDDKSYWKHRIPEYLVPQIEEAN